MFSKIITGFALVVAMFLTPGCFWDKEKPLVVGLSADYPPFAMYQDGQIVGFEPDLAKEIASRLNRKLVIQDMVFYGLVSALKTNKIDLIISGMSKTEERSKSVNFSDGYYKNDVAVIYDSTKGLISAKSDLSDKIVGVQTGSVLESWLKDPEQFRDIKIFSQDDNLILAEHLKSGKIDAFVVGALQAIEFAKSDNRFSYIIIDSSDLNSNAIAVNKDNHELLLKVNEILSSMKLDGSFAKIEEKWIKNSADISQNSLKNDGHDIKK